MNTKKLLSFVLALVTVVSCMCIPTFAKKLTALTVGENYTFTLSGKTMVDDNAVIGTAGDVKCFAIADEWTSYLTLDSVTQVNDDVVIVVTPNEVISADSANEIEKAVLYKVWTSDDWVIEGLYVDEIRPSVTITVAQGVLFEKTAYDGAVYGGFLINDDASMSLQYKTIATAYKDNTGSEEQEGISFTALSMWGRSALYVSTDDTVKAGTYYVQATVVNNSDDSIVGQSDFYPLVISPCYLDLDEEDSTYQKSKDIVQKYNLTETEGDKEDVTKVKVSWEITDINVTRTDEMVWDTATLKWVSSDASYSVINDGQAVFTLENYSTVKIDATASFVAEAGFNPTVTFDDETGTDGKIMLDTANGNDTYDKNNVPSAEITVTVTPSDGDFEGKDAAQGETYGTYTVTIAEHEEEEDTCFAAGTKITMADGTLKNIEDVRENDYVLTFNHEKGVYENQRVYLAYQGEYKKAAFTLGFANGATLSVVGVHDLFELETLCYVTLTEDNAAQFVGKHFYSVNDGAYVALTSVTYEKTPTAFYSVYTAYSANCVANGFLSVPDDDDERLNIYDFNEDLTVDLEQLANDVAAFGLYEYTGCTSASEELFDELAWKYINVMIGKGLGTMEDFVARRDAFLGE